MSEHRHVETLRRMAEERRIQTGIPGYADRTWTVNVPAPMWKAADEAQKLELFENRSQLIRLALYYYLRDLYRARLIQTRPRWKDKKIEAAD